MRKFCPETGNYCIKQCAAECIDKKHDPSQGRLYHRFPNGHFEEIGGPWYVLTRKLMPRTPSGDIVGEFETKEEADAYMRYLDDNRVDWQDAIEKYEQYERGRKSGG